MPQSKLNIRMDSDVKQAFESVCAEIGISITAAFTVFAKAVIDQREIPFKLRARSVTTMPARTTPTKLRGMLRDYANPSLIPLEGEAWRMAMEEKHGCD